MKDKKQFQTLATPSLIYSMTDMEFRHGSSALEYSAIDFEWENCYGKQSDHFMIIRKNCASISRPPDLSNDFERRIVALSDAGFLEAFKRNSTSTYFNLSRKGLNALARCIECDLIYFPE